MYLVNYLYLTRKRWYNNIKKVLKNIIYEKIKNSELDEYEIYKKHKNFFEFKNKLKKNSLVETKNNKSR